MSGERVGLVAFVFTDLVGSTGLDDELVRDHVALMCETVAHGGGDVVKTLGDGVMAAFTSATQAAECAAAMQRTAAAGPPDIGLRTGVHAGEATRDGGDYSGRAVAVARRLCDQARPGQVLCSDVVRSLSGATAGYRPLGRVPLKGLPDPVDVVELLWQEDVAPALAPQGSALVGRVGELQELTSAVEKARTGRGGLALVTGDPGIGKTRLAEEITEHAHRVGASVQWGSCWEAGGAPAYWPWTEVLRGLVRDAGLDVAKGWAAESGGVLGQLLPALGEGDGGQGDPDRFQLFDAVVGFLDSAAEVRPIVLVLDDLHAADRSSLLLLHFVGRRLRSMRVFIIGTSRDLEVERDEELSSLMAEIGRLGPRVPLSGLTEDEVGVLLERITRAPQAPDVVETVLANTGGNPFFVDEVARLLAAGRGAAVPAGAKHAVRQNLGYLQARCRDALAVASVFGREFSLDRLAAVIDETEDELLTLLDDAVAARVVRPASSAVGRFQFAHALVRDTLYEDLPADRRRQWHQTIADHLEGLGAEPAELARHFLLAGSERARDFLVEAGDRSMAQLAYEDAIAHFRRALELAGGGMERYELLERLYHAVRAAGRGLEMFDVARELHELARRSRDPELFGRAALFIVPSAEHIPVIDEALAGLDESQLALRAKLLARQVEQFRESEQYVRAIPTARDAVDAARRSGDDDALMAALDALAQSLQGDPGLEERQAVVRELLSISPGTDMTHQRWAAHHRIGTAVAAGDIAELDDAIRQATEAAAATKRPADGAMVVIWRAMRALLDGDLAAAEPLVLQAQAVSRAIQGGVAPALLTQLFHLRREQGRPAEIEGEARQYAEGFPQFPWRQRYALVLLDLGRIDEARAAFDAMAERDFQDLRRDNLTFSLPLLAELAWALDDPARAELLYQRVLPYQGQCFDASGAHVYCTGAVTRYLGLLAATLGRTDEAVAYLEDALAMHEHMSARLLLAHTQVDLALVRPDHPDTAALRAAAGATAEELGLVLVQRRLGGGVPRDAAPAQAAPPAAETQPASFLREGETWAITFEGNTVRLRHSRGLELIARLLTEPGRELHALDLEQGTPGAARTSGTAAGDVLAVDRGAGAGPALDAQAKRAYKQRLDDLEDEIDEATLNNDPARVEKAEAEKAFLLQELQAAVGLGGRDRPTASAAERARVNVTRAIRSALSRVEEHHPGLGAHLAATVRTGGFCAYAPDPRVPIHWEVG